MIKSGKTKLEDSGAKSKDFKKENIFLKKDKYNENTNISIF